MSIILRNIKGAPLTFDEMDNNFKTLRDKVVYVSGDILPTQNEEGETYPDGTIFFQTLTDGTQKICIKENNTVNEVLSTDNINSGSNSIVTSMKIHETLMKGYTPHPNGDFNLDTMDSLSETINTRNFP